MTAGAIVIRPADDSDMGYVFSTARRQAAMHNGGPFVNWNALVPLVDRVLRASDILVAFLPDDPENISGWVAFGPEMPGETLAKEAVEFIYLRRSLFEEGSPETTRAVLVALLARCGKAVTFKRAPNQRLNRPGDIAITILDAVAAAGLGATVKPVSV